MLGTFKIIELFNLYDEELHYISAIKDINIQDKIDMFKKINKLENDLENAKRK